jgi:hypothetical protein
MTSTDLPAPATATPPGGASWKRFGLLALLLAFAGFWTWALFFASKDAVNKIGDREWAERAESICAVATVEREALADFTRIDQPTPDLIARRADVVDAATDVLERMLDDVTAVAPSDPKGAQIVPDWAADYRTYLADRRAYADELRTSGENLPFYETAAGTIPISEKVATFAGDNEMPSCAPPRDLS